MRERMSVLAVVCVFTVAMLLLTPGVLEDGAEAAFGCDWCGYWPPPCGCIPDSCIFPDAWSECCCFCDPCYRLCECNMFGHSYCQGWMSTVCEEF